MLSYAILRFQMGFDPNCFSASYFVSPVPGEKSGWTPRSCARAKAKTLGTSGLGSQIMCGWADSRSLWIFQVMCQVMCR